METENLDFDEQELLFEENILQAKSIFDSDLPTAVEQPEVMGIKIRVGKNPIIRNIKKLIELSNGNFPSELKLLFEDSDLYTVTHAIGAIQIKGNARLTELHYTAEITNIPHATSIDLLPDTRYLTVLSVNNHYEAAFKSSGKFSAQIPEELRSALSGKSVCLGGDLDLQLSTKTEFLGKLCATLKFPKVISSGIASNTCTWVIFPEDNPLLGDQLMVQTISVPKGTSSITYQAKATAKVKKGFFKTDSVDTAWINFTIKLTP